MTKAIDLKDFTMFTRLKLHRHLTGALSVVALLAMATACAGSPEGDTDGSTLRFGFVGATELPADEFGWGLDQGIVQSVFAEHGIDNVETTGFGTGPDLNEAVIGNRIDVTSSGDTPALTARGAGADTKLLSIPSYMYSIVIATAEGPASIQELEGKKIAVVKGSTMHRFIVDALAADGIEAEIININATGDSIASMRRGEVDAVATVPYMQVVNDALKNSDTREIVNASDYGIKSLRVNTVAEEFLDSSDGFPEAWAQARSAVLAEIHADPGAYYNWLADLTASPREDVERLYPLDAISESSLDSDDVAALSDTKDFLVEQKLIRGDFDIDAWTASPQQQ